MPPEQKSALERLNQRLYSPNQNFSANDESLSARKESPSGRWQAPPPPPPKPPRKHLSPAVWFLIIAVLFAVAAAGISFLFIVLGTRAVSSDKLDLVVSAPTTIASGTTVPITITIKNHNPATITNTDLSMDFPDGTRTADDVTQPLVRYTDTLGSIPAGGQATRTVQAVLFGSVNQTITIPIVFNYHTANSNALFTKKQDYTVTVTSSPLTIAAQTISNAASGQPFTISVAVRSNATTPLDNIAVAAQYPAGFTPRSTNASSTGPLFTLGTLQPGEEKDINITGALSGAPNDQRSFEFTVGTTKPGVSNALAVAYASTHSQITLTKAFLSADLSLNHSSTDPLVVSEGDTISGLATWMNTLAAGITGGQVKVQISGNAYDPSSVRATNGYYDSSQHAVVFTRDTEPSLAHLNAGDTGSGSFTVNVKSGSAFRSLQNPTIQFSVSVAGTPDGSTAAQSISSTLTRTVKVSTSLQLASRLVRTTGPFQNSGPWPPVPNQPTTYTVLLSVGNTVNSVGGATITTILPSYVTFTGKVSPNDGSITYDSSTRKVTWRVGTVNPNQTTQKGPQGAFQISFTPSSSQSGMSPALVGNQTVTGTDRFTETQVESSAPALTTQVTTDPAYQPSFGIVGK